MLKKIVTALTIILYMKVSYCQTDSISNKTWYKKFNQAFGSVATGQGEAANLANYGSFEPVNGLFKLNVFGPLGPVDNRIAPFYSFSAGGKIVGDNSSVLFSNSKFNSGANLNGKLHFLLFRHINAIHTSGNEEDSILAKIQKLKDKKEQARLSAEQDFDTNFLKVSYRNDTQRLANISKLLAYNRSDTVRLLQILRTISNNDTAKLLRITDTLLGLANKRKDYYADSVRLATKISATKILVDAPLLSLNNLNGINQNNETEYQKKRDTLEMSITVKGSQFLWLTVVGNIERKKYYTFKDNAPFLDQLHDKKFTTTGLGVEFNYIGYGGELSPVSGALPHIQIANLGILRIKNNNIGDLSTTELSDSRKYSSHDSAHSLATKYNVYTDEIVEYKAWKIYANYYYYFGKKRNVVLHVFPDVEFRDTDENPFNLGAGLVFAIKNKKDNAVFNIELYGKLLDLGNALKAEDSKLINRNVIGINFGIPINFPNLK